MVLATSVIVAVLEGEPEAGRLARALAAADRLYISAGTLLETGIVMEARRGEAAGREVDLMLHRLRVQVVSVTEDQAELARSAYRSFGKGRHSAGLNYGDCFSYTLAKSLSEPLLSWVRTSARLM